MPRTHTGAAQAAPKQAGDRIRRPDPQISEDLGTLIDALAPHADAFGLFGTGMVTLARATRDLTGVVDEGFVRIDERFDRIDERFDQIDDRFDRMESRFENMESRFDNMETRFGMVEDDLRRLTASVERLTGYIIRDETGGDPPQPPKPRSRKPPQQR
jgi:hypothetical protein